MCDVIPFFTLDGSVGLYSKSDNDIFHSVYGAFSEAYDKFILPANFYDFINNNSEIKILDLCYGIGYNSKSFLNYFFEKCNCDTENNETIHTNNIVNKKCNEEIYTNNKFINKYNFSIYSNNIFKRIFCKCKNKKNNKDAIKKYKIKIDAIDINENLMKISPLLKTKDCFSGVKRTGIDKVDKYLRTKRKLKNKYNLLQEVNMLLLMSMTDNSSNNYITDEFFSLLNGNKWKNFINRDMRHFMQFYVSSKGICLPKSNTLSFLHNIYYKYISKSYKNVLKVLKNNEILFNGIIADARCFLSASDEIYDFIFLDAFTPSKCPSLWTYDFFKLLHSHLSKQGKILTYSNSASVRNAFLKNNFYVGKIFNDNENKFTGTIASKSKNAIEYGLSEYEFGLLNTKAGIMYRDENLNETNENILKRRLSDFEQSDLISATKYINNYKGDKNEI